MKTMKFKCTLLSDLVLSQVSSSEGNQKTLDFIPGNNFLGIVASQLYPDNLETSRLLFHSGKVRFGDAHPAVNDTRGLRVPASMYYPKLKKASDACYIHHIISNPCELAEIQLKQCRSGFFAFMNDRHVGEPAMVSRNFILKSGYDSVTRRSKDGQMFGYESLSKGMTLFFEVESDLDDDTNKRIVESLTGMKHIGRSRSAEFGLVEIAEYNYNESVSTSNTINIKGEQYVSVYADGRLIFLDEQGEPTFQPTAESLGLPGGSIDWEKSQIRIFQYSPWNGRRHTYDTDRCGIEKGSVFVVKCTKSPHVSTYVGCYQNEGFGKVIYNPNFLQGDPSQNGKALYALLDANPDAFETNLHEGTIPDSVPTPNTPLANFLLKQYQRQRSDSEAYRLVQDFVNQYAFLFRGEKFASQWGSIRSLAESLPLENLRDAIIGFLSHGVAKEKWEQRGRRLILDRFMNEHPDNLKELLINLASEMAKRSDKEI